MPLPSDAETPAAATAVEEIDSSDDDVRRPIRPTKKRRTAAEVATASFAAVRTAELSQSQSQSQEVEEAPQSPPAPVYTGAIFSPHADHSYEVEVVSYYDSEAEEAYAAANTSAKGTPSAEKRSATSKAVSVANGTQESEVPTPSRDQSGGGARAEQNTPPSNPRARETDESAIATTPERASPAARISPTQAKQAPVRGTKVADAGADSKKPRTPSARVVEFKFVTDATFPEVRCAVV